MGTIDPKAAAGALGAALGGLLWFLLAQFDVGGIGDWTTDAIATATGFTVTILAFVLAYLVPNASSSGKGR